MKHFILLFTTLAILSCTNSKDSYTLSGNALGYADGTKVFLYGLDQSNQTVVLDTLEIQNEQFQSEYPNTTETSVRILKVDGSNANVLFFVENEDVLAKIYADSVSASHAIGGKENELYNEFIAANNAFGKRKAGIREAFQNAQSNQDNDLMERTRQENLKLSREEKNYQRNFATQNSNSFFGLMLISELVSKNEITPMEASELLAKLSPKLASHPLAKELSIAVENAKSAEIGGIAPDFQAPTPTGELLSLKDAMGKYTIIDFWASWCRPCRLENPNVVHVYEKYHEKGLNIISVSLDREGQKELWVQAIKDDNLSWYHVSNLQFWQDPIARQYNIRSIPATFLLDADGKIIDKNLRGEALEARIAALLD
ncbi:MAG TPA: TlpA disulfide reductase family protein [Flavobacteriaceae bacterium]|nr:AhpC/TSA family protein [Flavobacteriaceae bacterium]MCB9213497.1 AhpC/TSA family protein [Alteromonas sp.]HPF12200.1 TlpA disulfide reductase family protein [Flavobacteriaceae bacterium]HQU22013.1 TlpA disulfide reductase family protein [Flavobacteriaceae bacterium]HQU65912.1 TlpA disulfide reductase family protein [Flavobacteriaceae bacterium]